MNKQKILHMLTLKSTWIVIASQIVLILNTVGVFDEIQADKFKIVSSSLLVVAEAIGLFSIYNSEPLKENEEK